MLLKEHLQEFTKKELIDEARNLGLKNYSKLGKTQLIEKLVEGFCSEIIFRNRMACLTKEQLILFRKACKASQEITINEIVDSMQLCRYWLGGFEEEPDRFCIYEEVAAQFEKIDDDHFKAEQHKKGWMMKCIHFFIEYYGIAPLEIIYEIYRLKIKDSIDEMIEMLWGMPIDIVESCIFPLESLRLDKYFRDTPIDSARGVLIHIPILENQELEYLLNQQMEKEFYVPSVKQIEEICRVGYEESSLAYEKLKIFFIKKLGLSYEKAVTFCLQTWANSYEGESPAEIINKINEAGIEFQGEKQINEFLKLAMDAHNNTRMKENRGHKPCELMSREFSGKMPTIVPGSTQAAALLKEAALGLEEMGLSVDLEGNADRITTTLYPKGLEGNAVTVEKKVYPNDPCPCGSGKKYKKCCGK